MNAQAYILQNNGIYNITFSEVDNFLTHNPGKVYSSNEIFGNLPSALKSRITLIASSYTRGACSSPASYVGVVASILTNSNASFSHEYHYFCPVLKRFDDGFKKN